MILAQSHLAGISVSLDIKSRDEWLPGIPTLLNIQQYICETFVVAKVGIEVKSEFRNHAR